MNDNSISTRNIVLRTIQICTIILIYFITLSCTSEDSKEIKLVKSGQFDSCQNKTVVQMIDGFFNTPKWSSGIGKDGDTKGKTIVNVKGKIKYMGKDVNGEVQFIVDTKDGSFTIHALEFNGIPQNILMINELFNKMCESKNTSQTDSSQQPKTSSQSSIVPPEPSVEIMTDIITQGQTTPPYPPWPPGFYFTISNLEITNGFHRQLKGEDFYSVSASYIAHLHQEGEDKVTEEKKNDDRFSFVKRGNSWYGRRGWDIENNFN